MFFILFSKLTTEHWPVCQSKRAKVFAKRKISIRHFILKVPRRSSEPRRHAFNNIHGGKYKIHIEQLVSITNYVFTMWYIN